MPVVSVCPGRQDLEQLLLGGLPEAEAGSIERHLLDCPACLETVSNLASQDTLLDAVRNHAAARSELDRYRAEIDALVVRITSACRSSAETSTAPPSGEEPTLPPEGASPAVAGALSPTETEDEEDFGFLAPPIEPGDLGRLGTYRVLRTLGAGGMGVVFEAEDPQLKRRVALKVMKPSLAAAASARKRFLREAQAAAAAEHDHIVAIHQVGEDRGVPFIAMPLLRGETLADRLKRVLPLPPGEGRGEGLLRIQNPQSKIQNGLPLADALRIGREIAEGLAAAHDRGLVHRDIKPANVWLESGGDRVKLLDFGLARAGAVGGEEQLTRLGAMMGTPAYMAPEQARGGDIDARADLFSLGCVLYHAVTGVNPFARRDAVSSLMAIAGEEPPPPKVVSSRVPDALSELIVALLSKSPAARPQSAREVVERVREIERAAGGVNAADLPLPRGEGRGEGEPGAMRPSPNLSQRERSQSDLARPLGEGRGEGCPVNPKSQIQNPKCVAPVQRQSHPRRRSWRAMPALRWAAAVLLFGAVIIIKYKDGTTQTIKTDKPVASITLEPADQPAAEAPPKTALPKAALPKNVASKTAPPLPAPLAPALDAAAAGERLAPLALVTRPAKLPGVKSWSLEAAGPTSVGGDHSVAIRPDSKFAAFGAVDGRIRIWELATGRLAKILLGGGNFVRAIDWSPDGKLLAAAMYNSRVYVWDFEAGELVADLNLQDRQLDAVAWSHDGQLLAIARNGGASDIARWGRASGRWLEPFGRSQDPLISSIAWSPTARRLATIDAKKSRIWDGDTGELLHELDSPGMYYANGLAWSPDGKLLACRGASPRVDVWNAETAALRNSFESPPTNDHRDMAWSPDGAQLAMLAGSEIHICNAATGARQSALSHPAWLGGCSLAWAKDGSRIIAGPEWGPIGVWDARSMKFERSLAELPARMFTAWSPKDRALAAACNGKIWFWEGKSELMAAAAAGGRFYLRNMAWSPAGDRLFGARHWDGPEPVVLSKSGEGDWAAKTLSVPAGVAAISPDGSRVAIGLFDAERKANRLELWDLTRGKLLREFDPFPSPVFLFHGGSVGMAKDYISWRPDQREIACGAVNGEVAIWNVESGELARTLDGFKTVHPAVAWSPAGDRLAVGGRGNDATVWICEATGKILHALPFDYVSYGHPLHLTWSADGETLQATSNHGMRRWNASTGRKVAQLDSPFKGLHGSSSASITADGRLAVAAGMDEVARIWDTETGEHLLTLVPLLGGGLAGISADGHYRALSDAPDIDEQLVYLVETDAGQQTLTPKQFAETYGWKNDPKQVRLFDSAGAENGQEIP